MQTRTWASAVAIAAVALFGWFGLASRRGHAEPGREARASAPADDGELRALKANSDRLEGELASLRGEMAQLREQVPARPLPAASTPVVEPEAPAMTEAEKREGAKRLWKEHMDQVAAAFQGEAKDPRWSGATRTFLREALKDDTLLRDRARNIECRSRTCRVEISRDGDDEHRIDNDMGSFAQKIAPQLSRMSADQVEDENGRTMVLYLSND